MSDDISARLRIQIRARANRRCEYCLLHEDDAWEPHQPDHIVARKHRGQTEPENLAWTCSVCNRRKGSDVGSIDEVTGKVVRLFHPRRDSWPRHFRLAGGRIVPRSSVGRVTEFLLQLNRPDRVQVREILYRKGLYPR
jgi:HNH endonuclease